jgi:hypothetical protein
MKKKLTTGQQQRRQIMLGVVEEQLRQNSPPETATTLKRLMTEGYSRDHAVELISVLVATEMFDVMKQQQPFNHERFVSRLHKLPDLPD